MVQEVNPVLNMMRTMLRIREAADALGVHPDTLRRWDRAGKLSCHRHPINGYRLYDMRQLVELLEDIALNHG